MNDLSVCVVTYNEAANIDAALKTVTFASEIIIVDSYSTDNTVSICNKYTDSIYLNKWEGCGIQRKFALSKVTKPWVLFLDADERLSIELQRQIIGIVNNNYQDFAGFYIPFKTFYLGQELKYGSCYRERHLRLFKLSCSKIIPKQVHFGLEVTGKIGNLEGFIEHYSFPNLDKALAKMNLYSSWGAKDQLQAGKFGGILQALCHGIYTFFKCYLLKLGFLDGSLGFIMAITNAEASYYKYVKLMLLNKAQS